MNLSPHFTLAELTHTDHRQFDNTPTQIEISNLQRLAQFLEIVKATLGGKPVIITSGYRSKAVNDAVGSKDSSHHRLGLAADFRVPGMAPDAVVRALLKLPYQQIIREFDAWTHISIPQTGVPHKQALIIDKLGVRPYV
jgi:zinc D-Ala-D-Ala carboxypeptidase